MIIHNSNSSAISDKEVVRDILKLIAIGVFGLLMLIANPGYYSHDEWQRFDYYFNNGFNTYIFQHSQIHVGTSFGTPVRPVAFLVQGIHNLFFQNYPFIVHLISAANTILVSIILYFGCMRYGLNRTTALIAGALLIISPLTALATGWSAALMDQLYVTFGLLTFFLAERYIFDGNKGFFTLLAIAAGGMASVLSKETGIIFPATLLLLIVLMPQQLFSRGRRLLTALSAWMVPIALYLLYRLSAIETSFSGAPEDPYAASLANIGQNIVVYWLYPFHTSIGDANGWHLLPLWSIWIAASLHSGLVVVLTLAYGLRSTFLYVFFYFLFLLPVLLLPNQGSHYLFASALPLSVALASLVGHPKIPVKVFAIAMTIILLWHGLAFQRQIYLQGHCMNRIAISLEANHASAGFPEDVFFTADSDAPTHVLLRLIFGRNQVGERGNVRFHPPSINQRAPGDRLILNLNKQCLLSVAQSPNVSVEHFGSKFTTEGVAPDE